MLRSIHHTLAFTLEIIMLIVFGWWGFRQGNNTFQHYCIAAALVIAGITLWGIWAAPRSKRRLSLLPRLVFSLCMFLSAAVLLYLSKKTALASGFAALAVISVVLGYVYRDDALTGENANR